MVVQAKPCRCGRLAFQLLSIAAAASTAGGEVIRPVSATSDDPLLFGDLANLIDGVIDFDQSAAIGGSVSGVFAGPYTVSFDLGVDYDLSGMQLWNNGGSIENDGEGIDAFTLRFEDADGGLLGTYSDNAADILAMQAFAFDVAGVRSVDLVIDSNHAPMIRNYAALYEVEFVPGPGVLTLLGLTALAHAGRRRG